MFLLTYLLIYLLTYLLTYLIMYTMSRFWAISIASGSVRLWDLRSCCTVLSRVMRGRPRGLLQSSGGRVFFTEGKMTLTLSLRLKPQSQLHPTF